MLPDNVAIKYATYTLYCNQMLHQLPALDQAVLSSQQPDALVESCLEVFNNTLREFFGGKDHPSVDAAASSLGQLLHAGINLLADAGSDVTNLFTKVINDAVAQATTWDFSKDVEQYHQQGRRLAQKFFQNSSFANTQQIANLVFEYGASDSVGRPPNVNLNLGFRVAPIATYHLTGSQGAPQPPQIVLRVSYDNNFFLYLAYPFLFLHEYTAHIFANDLKNAPFNDGWMLFAASDFLGSDWLHNNDHSLQGGQAWVFAERFLDKIGRTPRRGHSLAHKLSALLERQSQGLSFESMTYELAAFVPGNGEKNFWPSQFMNVLSRELNNDSVGLRKSVEAAIDVRHLFASL